MGKKRAAQIQAPVKDAKKQKVNKKQEKIQSEHSEQPEKVSAPQAKKTEKKAAQLDVFSEQFYRKLDDFQSLYRDFLNNKNSISDSDIESQMKDVTTRVSQSIQNQASAIFKGQLQNLEKWIKQEIRRIQEEVKAIENVYEQNRQSLLKTGAFTQDQVKKQLSPIQAKASSRKQIQEKYQNLLVKSKQIYGQN